MWVWRGEYGGDARGKKIRRIGRSRDEGKERERRSWGTGERQEGGKVYARNEKEEQLIVLRYTIKLEFCFISFWNLQGINFRNI